MKLAELVDFLDAEFGLTKLEEGELIDVSMMSRIKLIPQEQRNAFLPSFFNTMNGLLFQASEDINFILLSTFLSDEVVLSIEKKGYKNSLLIVHHLFDMNCGTPDKMNGVPFHFLSVQSLEIIKRCKLSIYAAHLPFDIQTCKFNTSLAFAKALSLSSTYTPLTIDALKCIGYKTETNINIGRHLNIKFPIVYKYGNGFDNDSTTKNVAIIAGVISNSTILENLKNQDVTHVVCGDIFVCVESERFREIYNYIQRSDLCIYCLSHNTTESYGMKMLADYITSRYDSVLCECVFENEVWK